MKFKSYFNLLNYVITKYDELSTDLILNDEVECLDSLENYEPTDKYIMWHAKNIGTDLSGKILLSGIIPMYRIKQKSKKYYLNILIEYNPTNFEFLEYAFYDIFFKKIKICVILSGFMRNYKLTLLDFVKYFKNYQVDYYVCTYDIVGMGTKIVDEYSQDKFDIEDLKKIIPVKKYIVKQYSKYCKKISKDISMNKLYYQTENIFDCYSLVDENYFFYIRTRADLLFENLDNILDTYFDDIINNKIIVHYLKEQEHMQDHVKEHVLDQDADNPEWSIKQKIPFDGFAICNIFIADIYCKFHLHIHNYSKNNKLPELPEQILYFYLVTKNINIIMDNICRIYRKDVTSRPINRAAILHGKR